MSEKEPFKVEQDGHIAWLILNRPEKLNAMSLDFFSKLTGHFIRFDEDPDIRVVIIKAEGKTFSAGIELADAEALIADNSARGRETLRKKIIELQESINAIEKCRKPVIAAAHGHCIGAGVDMLCACDIRLAAKDAIFSVRETRMAMIADVGTLQRLPLIIGHGWARELVLTGRDFTAEEALQMGFITRICKDKQALYEEAKTLASQIATCAPLAVQGVKDVILFSRDNGIYPGLHYVAQKNAAALQSEDLTEAVNAFMEKRKPAFKGN